MPHVAKKTLLFALVVQAAFYYAGLYDLAATRHARVVLRARAARAWSLGALVLLLAFYVVPALEIGRGIFLVAIALSALVVPAWRMLYNERDRGLGVPAAHAHRGQRRAGARARPGRPGRAPTWGSSSSACSRATDRRSTARPASSGRTAISRRSSRRERIDFVLVAYPGPARHAAGRAAPRGEVPRRRGRGGGHVLRARDGEDLRARAQAVAAHLRRGVRRAGPPRGASSACSTSSFGALGLLLAAPLMLVTALAIKLDSPGPILYRQVRAGEFGRAFTLYKFRSMRIDAESPGRAVSRRRTTLASPASAASSARRASTSCRSSGTSSGAR